MGYFANGSEGDWYEDQYCSRCVHNTEPEDGGGCAVLLAHLIHNYDECNKKDSILHILIPRSKDGLTNEECKMFIDRSRIRESQAELEAVGQQRLPTA